MNTRFPHRYFVRRLGHAVLVMVIVVFGNFVLLQAAPGDAIDVLSATTEMTSEQIDELRTRYGLDQPLPVQFVRYAMNLARLDLGYSISHHAPASHVVFDRVGMTLILVVSSLVVSFALGTLIGVISARIAESPAETFISACVALLYSMPPFVVSVLMILIFSISLDWLPIAGPYTYGSEYTGIEKILDYGVHLIMPVAALSTFYLATYARIGRAAVLEVLHLDYIRTARAKGLPERVVIYKHALRNALLPLITMAGLQVSTLIGGTVVIEMIFGLPGLGRTAYEAVMERDTNLLLAVLFITSVGVVLVNIVVDIIYMIIDPRISYT